MTTATFIYNLFEGCTLKDVPTPTPEYLTKCLVTALRPDLSLSLAVRVAVINKIVDTTWWKFYDWSILGSKDFVHVQVYEQHKAAYAKLPWHPMDVVAHGPAEILGHPNWRSDVHNNQASYLQNPSLTRDLLIRDVVNVKPASLYMVCELFQFDSFDQLFGFVQKVHDAAGITRAELPRTVGLQPFVTAKEYASLVDRSTTTFREHTLQSYSVGFRMYKSPHMTPEVYERSGLRSLANLVYSPNVPLEYMVDRMEKETSSVLDFEPSMKFAGFVKALRVRTDLSVDLLLRLKKTEPKIGDTVDELIAEIPVFVDFDENGKFIGLENCVQKNVRTRRRIKSTSNDFDDVVLI